MKKLFVFLLGLLMSTAVFAQQKTITGTVSDASGPLPGANVIVKGTTVGIVTTPDGKFSLEVPGDASTLVISFIGYVAQEIDITETTNVDVMLLPDAIGIEEVVAIGYGTAKKSDLTGAVASVQGEAIAERQTTQISQALQGAVSGVMVTRDNSGPGSGATIRIRGITTIGDNEPLIIVDGVPVDNINDVNPNDIQDMSVLKDAASASIYGSRAAAGVILITTKRAKAGDLKLSYTGEYGIEKPTTWPKGVDVIRYMQMDNEMRWNDNGNQEGSEYSTYSQDQIENYWQYNAENPNIYPFANTDWHDLVLKESAPRQSHNLSITAGSKTIRTKVSLNYDNIEGLYKHKEYERWTARANNSITINKFISTSVDMYWKRSISYDAATSPWGNLHLAPPVYPAIFDDGRIANGKAGANVYGVIEEGGTDTNWYNTIGGKAQIDFKPLDGLTISGVVAPEFGFTKGKEFQIEVPTTIYEDPTVYEGSLYNTSSTKLTEKRNDNNKVTSQILATYIKSFGNHNLNVFAGYENYSAFYENLGASRDKYLLTSFPYLNLGPLELRDNSGNAYENAYRSYIGRIMYNYNNRYFLQANVRHDGSSRFHEDYRWGTFPSVSGGWIISEENFMDGSKSVLSFLKLRASWGQLGNERIGNYPYQATISFNDALFYQGNEVVSQQTAAQTQYAIRDISWETTESTDIGFDAYLFDSRFRLTADYYMKETKDMLLALEIPDFIGFDNPDQNTGKMETKGYEFEMGWNDNVGDLKYSVSFNLSDSKTKMGDLGGTEFLGDKIKKEGSEFNEWYGYVSDGLFQTQEEIDNSPKLSNSVKPGDVKYVDISGPDGEPDGIISPEYDRKLLGGSLPRYLYGGNIKLDYKGFDFSLVVQGVGKQTSRLTTTMVQPLRQNWGNAPEFLDGDYWSVYNTPEQNLQVQYPRLSWSSRGNNYAMSDYWLFDGSYFRLKNITLGYTLPKALTQKVGMSKVRVYASGSDLLTIDNYPKGWDPEVGAGYPITQSYVFGVNVNF
ncbi:TonB-dependent receptor [uncultured Draconibacterium sp.]|uniref:SusC/RagA family TonB-linked outer membrane protein n=1 Tax=uncultured Draconibacterium sp. TaxID=1573823 RepID=UPI0029BFDC6F|nr:TonB-dependent receptor [uncultured Draconibacterium sp.]